MKRPPKHKKPRGAKATRSSLDKRLARERTARRKLAELIFPKRSTSAISDLVTAWRRICITLQAVKDGKLSLGAFSHGEEVNGEMVETVTIGQDLAERTSDVRRATLDAVEAAFVSWDSKFFAAIARDMNRVSREKGYWPDPTRLEMLKAARHGPVKLTRLQRALSKAGVRGCHRKSLSRIAKKIGVKTVNPGRPKSH